MKSTELYRHLRAGLGTWFRAEGFKRAEKAQLGWHRPGVFVWFQCDKWGWDRYAGSSFFVNFQAGGRPEPWGGPMERLQHYLRPDELEVVRGLQNNVIRKLSPPPPGHVEALRAAFSKTSKDPDGMIEALLAGFRPVEQPYCASHDFSLRYFDPDDIRNWSSFLLEVMPRIVEQLQHGGAAQQSDAADEARFRTEPRG